VLPDKDVLAKFQERLEARAEAGPDAACHCCGKLESQGIEHSMTSRKGERVIYTRKWRIHALIPKKLLCEACWAFVNKNKRLRTPEEVTQYLRFSDLMATRAAGGEIQCDNCGAVENPSKRGHIANSETGKVLCYLCDSLARSGKTRDSGHVQRLEIKKQLKADREAGRPIVCSNCGTTEDPSAPKAKPFLVNKRSGRLMCTNCSNTYNRAFCKSQTK
jgi:hypothetical protein